MDKRDIIELYRNVVIQIATPYSTGTGFYLKEHNLIISNEHVVRDNREVVIDGKEMDKQKVKVTYVDPKYDLSFLEVPPSHKMPPVQLNSGTELNEGDLVIAVGHPFGLKYTATEGIISNMLHKQNDIEYIQHDAALNPGNSGGPLLNRNGSIIGVNTFIIRDGNNIGFSLPVKYLHQTLDEFSEGNQQAAVRCNSCLNIVFEETVEDGYCPHCGSKIKMISEIETYEPFGVNKTIEEMLSKLEYNIELSRRGPNNWQINKGSALINISYHEKSGLIVGDAYLCLLPKRDIKPLYSYLLRENYQLNGLTFSVKEQDIIISLLIYDQYLNVETGTELFKHLFEAADHYDDILVDKYGATWKSEP